MLLPFIFLGSSAGCTGPSKFNHTLGINKLVILWKRNILITHRKTHRTIVTTQSLQQNWTKQKHLEKEKNQLNKTKMSKCTVQLLSRSWSFVGKCHFLFFIVLSLICFSENLSLVRWQEITCNFYGGKKCVLQLKNNDGCIDRIMQSSNANWQKN